ncbi:MAG: hypothetical protein A2X49_07655 [Lentisphaerae bacterium GWF2_52_8]|nr:MAG: hypothetical protein A2X49_07655 [Lentisphaerae bacterium GWF2_52_8]
MNKSDFKQVKDLFTLIELLMVIAIIALMMTLLLPALSTAKRSAKKITCIGQMKQLMMASWGYANDYRGWGNCYWNANGTFYGGGQFCADGVLSYHGYLNKTPKRWKWYTQYLGMTCPEFYMPNEYKVYADYGVLGYSMNCYAGFQATNDLVTGIGAWTFNFLQVKKPVTLAIWVDGNNATFGIFTTLMNYTVGGQPVPRHLGISSNFAFVDGHVKNYTVANQNLNEIKINNL